MWQDRVNRQYGWESFGVEQGNTGIPRYSSSSSVNINIPPPTYVNPQTFSAEAEAWDALGSSLMQAANQLAYSEHVQNSYNGYSNGLSKKDFEEISVELLRKRELYQYQRMQVFNFSETAIKSAITPILAP